MKKLFYSVLALAGIFAVSCNKEIEKSVVSIQDTPSVSTHTVTIRADFAAQTRTAYANDKTFSWVEGDTIHVYTVNEATNMARVAKLVAQESGASVDFKGEIEDGFEPTSFAVYTASNSWLTWDENDFYVYLPGTTAIDDPRYEFHVDSSNPMSNVPLVGDVDDEGVFHFSTATGVLKFNLADIPSEAAYFELTAADGNMLQGFFAVDLENGTINRDGGKEGTYTYTDEDGNEQTARYSYTNVFYKFTPDANGKATIYVPVPVGTLGAGATIELLDSEGETLFTKKTKKDITIERNKITELVELSAKVEWVSLGTGLFGDHTQFNADYDVEVEIQQNASEPTQFRLVDPYAGYRELLEYEPTGSEYGPDEYLYFRILQKGESINGISVTHDDLVYFDAYYTGIADDTYEVDPFLAHPARWAEEEDLWLRSIVVKYQADGVTPANVQLAPILFWVTDPDAGRGYWSGDNYLYMNNMIEIRFPGAERIDLQASASYIEIVDSDPAQAIALVDASFSSAIAGAKLVIAADAAGAAAAFADAAAVTTVTASGECEVKLPANAPSGNYYIYMQTTVADGLTASANQLVVSEKFYYNNANTDLGIDVSVLYGTWTGDIIRNTSAQGYFRDTFTLAFEESDDPLTGGDVLITEIYGETATIPVYGWFDGKTGLLTIAPDQPWTEFNESYDVGMVDAQNPTKDLVFRYREDGSLYLESCEFVAFYLYNTGTNVQSDYWWGYFYGDSDDYHLTMTKTTSASAPAKAKKAHANHSFGSVSKVASTSHIPTQAVMER